MLTIIFTYCFGFMIGNENPSLKDFTGTFSDQNYQKVIKIKKIADSLHGVIFDYSGAFPLFANLDKNRLEGKILVNEQMVKFYAIKTQFGFEATIQGNKIAFYKILESHNLEGYDIGQFFLHHKQIEEPDISYTDQNKSEINGYGAFENLIAGGQLVYYTRSSIMSGNNASSITYLNFCVDGTFHYTYEGSYSVEGNYGGNVHGASNTDQWGYWEISTHQGTPSVKMTYANGEISYQAINEEKLKLGRWRHGNTQYAFQSNKAICR